MFINNYPDTTDGDPDVIAFCPDKRIVLLTDDRVLNLSGYIDSDGDPMDEFEGAQGIVAQSDRDQFCVLFWIDHFEHRALS